MQAGISYGDGIILENNRIYAVPHCGRFFCGSGSRLCTCGGSIIFSQNAGASGSCYAGCEIGSGCLLCHTGADMVFVQEPVCPDIVSDGTACYIHQCARWHWRCGQGASGDGAGISDTEDACGKVYLPAADNVLFLFRVQGFTGTMLEGGRGGRGNRDSKGVSRRVPAAGKGIPRHAGLICMDTRHRGVEPGI